MEPMEVFLFDYLGTARVPTGLSMDVGVGVWYVLLHRIVNSSKLTDTFLGTTTLRSSQQLARQCESRQGTASALAHQTEIRKVHLMGRLDTPGW